MQRVESLKLGLLALLMAVTVVNCKERKGSVLETHPEAKSTFAVPLLDVQKKTIYQISAEQDTVLYYETGSKLSIPENAFLYIDGQPVKGEVKLTYRELTDAFDIYIAGIPMQYDSAGVEQVFETAGMIEINAYSGNLPIFVNPESKIKVEMVSNYLDNRFNIYSLDTTSSKWNFISKSNARSTTYADELEKLPSFPPEPKRAGLNAFTVKDCTGEVPELDIYRNVLFEPVDGNKHGFQATNIKVKDLENGKYRVTFVLFDGENVLKKDSCDCYLSFKEGENFDNAPNTYRHKYFRQIVNRDKVRKEIETEWEAYYKAVERYSSAADNVVRRFLSVQREREVSNLKVMAKITRTLDINGFGYINFDYPTIYPSGADLLADYKDNIGNDLVLKAVVMAESGKNALFKCTNRVRFNPQKDNILWGFTSDNRLAVFKMDDFKKIGKYSGKYTFVMKVYPDTLNTYEDISYALFE